MNLDDISRQQEYYRATAATYNERHVSEQDEHALALAVFVAIAQHVRMTGSFLDVGAGTGRAMRILSEAFPEARVEGIEPVADLFVNRQKISTASRMLRSMREMP